MNEEPTNIVEFFPPTEIPGFEQKVLGEEPKFHLAFPPHPRNRAVQDVCDKFEKLPLEEQVELSSLLEQFYADLYYAAGGGFQIPDINPKLSALDKNLRGLIHVMIPDKFKEWHFSRGWNDMDEEDRKALIRTRREQNEVALLYAHLPKEGATLQMKDGSSRLVPMHELNNMVDAGLLPKNPDANVPIRTPNVDASKPVIHMHQPIVTGTTPTIIKP